MKYLLTLILIMGFTFPVLSTPSSSIDKDLSFETSISIELDKECFFFEDGEVFLLNGPSCSHGDISCNCAEGQCCNAGENECACTSCDEGSGGGGFDWWPIIRDMIPIIFN